MKKLNKLFLENPGEYKKIILTDFQIHILNSVRQVASVTGSSVTAKELAPFVNINQSSLSTNLSDIYKKGYLARTVSKKRARRGEYHYSISL